MNIVAGQPQQADVDRLSAIYNTEASRVYGLLITRCGDPRIAEELTSQTFEAAASKFAQNQGGEVTPAWLTTVCLRRLVDYWRSTGRRTRLIDKLAGIRQHDVHLETPDSAVFEALGSLSSTQRAALTLRYLDDWPVAEIAEVLQLSYRATESLLARARSNFRRAYGARGGSL